MFPSFGGRKYFVVVEKRDNRWKIGKKDDLDQIFGDEELALEEPLSLVTTMPVSLCMSKPLAM